MPNALQVVAPADAREHQQLGRADGAGAYDHLARGPYALGLPAPAAVDHAHRARPLSTTTRVANARVLTARFGRAIAGRRYASTALQRRALRLVTW